MSELIKREDAIKATWHEPSYTDPYNVLTEVRDRIEALPTVDAVPVVRCGECGHYHSEDDPAYCDELCTIHIEPTDGCLRGIKRGGKVGYRAADGERKDGAV